MSDRVTLSLISHTNVGKTTLARTLLRRDVGEVLDQAHVTEISEAHKLIEIDGAALQLWDTPGFGDSSKLLRRLRQEKNPLGWFLHQVWDRVVDRPLWCSQEAIRNIKEEADVVLYLVNASEDPQAAGYVDLELELLTWMQRPVILLLNQTGAGGTDVGPWRDWATRWPVVRDVLQLDAFARCWVEEGVLLRRVERVLDGDARDVMTRLSEEWDRRNLAVYATCVDGIARYLDSAAVDSEKPGPGRDRDEPESLAMSVLGDLTGALKFSVDKRRAMAALNERLDRRTAELMQLMISGHGLDGASAAPIEQRIQDLQVKGGRSLTGRTGALAGAVVSGALGGLAADALSGGLTLGGGMIAGGILGALGGGAIARGYRMIGGDVEPHVRWTPEFLDLLVRQALLRYLAVAHYGRGRGEYTDLEQPESWKQAVDDALATHRAALDRVWSAAESAAGADPDRSRLPAIVDSTLREVLRAAYPGASVLETRAGDRTST